MSANQRQSAIDAAVQSAFRCQQLGDLKNAEQFFRNALALAPRNPLLHHYLGVVAMQQNRVQEAGRCFDRALGLDSTSLNSWFGRLDAAVKLGRAADVPALLARGGVHLKSDQLAALAKFAHLSLGAHLMPTAPERAKAEFAEVLKRDPNDFQALAHLGALLLASYDIESALPMLRRAVELNPQDFGVALNLATALYQGGGLAEAETMLLLLHDVAPGQPEVLSNLANVLNELGKTDPAETFARQACAAVPTLVEPLLTLGAILAKKGDASGSISAYGNALRLEPKNSRAHAGLALGLFKLGQLAEAEGEVRQMLDSQDLDTLLPVAWMLMGGSTELVAELLCPALERDPGNIEILNVLIPAVRTLCDWTMLLELDRALAARLSTPESLPLRQRPAQFDLMYLESMSATDLRRYAELGTAALAAPVENKRLSTWPGAKAAADGRIRVGYLLADARDHANGFNSMLLYSLHDRSRFEVFVYSTGIDDGKAVRKRIEADVEHFVDLNGQRDEAIARRIADDGIQVLVDLMGHTRDNSLGALALRPAPVQINYLGYPGTSGAPFIDYIIGDPVVTPLEHAAHFSEAIIQLPHCYQANNLSTYGLDPQPPRSELGLHDESFVFCCFNAANKLTPGRFASWMRILDRSPDAVLWLLATKSAMRDNLLQVVAAHGIAPERVIFAAHQPRPEHLRRLQAADLFLDTAPVGAHTTATDALWAGVPVLTVLGETFAARVTASVVRAAGLGDMVMPDEATYEARAIDLANRPGDVDTLKSRLRDAKATCPLFDMRSRVCELEAAYEAAWARHLEGKPPAAIRLAPPEAQALGT